MIKFPIEKTGALLITDRKTRKYFTGVDVAEGYVIKSSCATVCFADARYYYGVKDKLESAGVKAILFNGLETIKEYLKKERVKRIYLDYTKETVTDYTAYKKLGFKLLDGSTQIKNLRSIKTSSEIERIKRACVIAEKAYHTAIKEVKKGITENALKTRIEELMKEFGAEGTSFETIVAFGKNSAIPHYETGDTVLLDNTVILVDMGCTVDGYCSDLTRTAYFGNPDEEFRKCYQAVLKANVLAEEQIGSGMNGKQADAIARSSLKGDGLDEYFTHSLGHGIGLDVHEYPTLSPKREDVLMDEMVFSIEPGVYLNEKFGIRIEDTVILENGKVKRLFTDDKNLIIL